MIVDSKWPVNLTYDRALSILALWRDSDWIYFYMSAAWPKAGSAHEG